MLTKALFKDKTTALFFLKNQIRSLVQKVFDSLSIKIMLWLPIACHFKWVWLTGKSIPAQRIKIVAISWIGYKTLIELYDLI